MFLPKWKHSDASVRRSAIKRLADLAVLEAIVEEEPSKELRSLALARLRDKDALARIAKNTKCTWRDRNSALERLGDESVAAFVARYDADERVRVAALQHMSDESALQELVRRDRTSAKVRVAAVQRISDFSILAVIAFTDPDVDVRVAAESRLANAPSLAALPRDPGEEVRRRAMLDCVHGADALAEIAATTADAKAGVHAVTMIQDETLLAQVEAQAKHSAVRKVARRTIKDHLVIARLWQEAVTVPSDGDSRVHPARLVELEQELGERLRLLAQTNLEALVEMASDNSGHLRIREKALGFIRDHRLLAKVAVFSKSTRVASAALDRITSAAALCAVARQARMAAVRKDALDRVEDQPLLAHLAVNDKDASVRVAAARRVTSEEVRSRIALEDPDDRVRAAAKGAPDADRGDRVTRTSQGANSLRVSGPPGLRTSSKPPGHRSSGRPSRGLRIDPVTRGPSINPSLPSIRAAGAARRASMSKMAAVRDDHESGVVARPSVVGLDTSVSSDKGSGYPDRRSTLEPLVGSQSPERSRAEGED